MITSVASTELLDWQVWSMSDVSLISALLLVIHVAVTANSWFAA